MEYSNTAQWVLWGVWAVGSLALAWSIHRPFYIYFGSVGLSAPAIGYSMVGYGLVEMGGIIHALCAGMFAVLFHFIFQRFKSGRQQSKTP